MLIDVVDNLEAFAKLRENWESTYEADPDAQFFLSWAWMSKWLEALSGPWFVLAAKPDAEADHVAFFPLRLRLKERKVGGFYNEISMAGNFGADYTGFICRPDCQYRAISAFARHIKTLSWARINIDNICGSEDRLRFFLSHFPKRHFHSEKIERINKIDNVNNCICPFVALPGDWDSYLANNLSSNTRQKIRRFLRQIEADPAFRITHAHHDTVERDLKVLLKFWRKQWGSRKGNRLENIVNSNFDMLRRCAETSSLFLPVLWRGETPLGALASLIDPQKKTLLFYIGGRDETFDSPPPGMVLHAHSIRHAISQGLTTYDFLRGNESYKYSFGATERKIACWVVGTPNGRNLGNKLDHRSLSQVLERAIKLHKANHLVQAERAYRQVLDIAPENPKALYCLGQMMAAEGRHGAAKRLFRALLAVKPDAEKAWLWLGRSLEAQRRFAEAADVYRKAITLNPDFAVAHNNLGNALFMLGRHTEAIAAFEKALSLDPGYTDAEISHANTLHMLGALPPEKLDRYAALNADLGDRIRHKGGISFSIHCYRQAIAMAPDLTQAHYGLAQALQAQGDVANALRSYRKVADLEPDYRDVADILSKHSRPSDKSQQPAQALRP